MRLLIPALLTLSICSFHTVAFGQSQKTFAKLAESSAPLIIQKVQAKIGGGGMSRLAVFAIGDSDGKVTPHVAEPSTVLQGELIYNLQKRFAGAAPPRCTVLTKAGLARAFADASLSVDPSSVNAAAEAAEVAATLKALKLDVALVGSMDIKSAAQITSSSIDEIRVSLRLLFADGTGEDVTGSVDTKPEPTPGDQVGPINQPPQSNVPPIAIETSGRFSVEVFSATDNFQKPLEIVHSKNPNSEYHKVYFLVLPKAVKDAVLQGPDATGSNKKAEYIIRISNKGVPFANVAPQYPGSRNEAYIQSAGDDTRRLFGVAVLVDGVNSFYEADGTGVVAPVVRHPSSVSRWILSGPKQKIVPTAAGYRLDEVEPGKGNSVVDVKGFQVNGDTAKAFEFAKASDSIAEGVGVTNDVGMIAVHFYPEIFNTDSVSLDDNESGAGTRAGRPLANPVVKINPKLAKNPTEVWRIFYRFADNLPIPQDEIQPVPFLPPTVGGQ